MNIDIALIRILFIDKKYIETNQKNTEMTVKEIINSFVLINFLPKKEYKSAKFFHFRTLLNIYENEYSESVAESIKKILAL